MARIPDSEIERLKKEPILFIRGRESRPWTASKRDIAPRSGRAATDRRMALPCVIADIIDLRVPDYPSVCISRLSGTQKPRGQWDFARLPQATLLPA